ncbi:MAG: DUF2059 domain-containing protein [Opitutaceae bacterium]|jgi:hypothetical protein|nr:DUF2059 domain-containing protein [Opitutaceae bacterium]
MKKTLSLLAVLATLAAAPFASAAGAPPPALRGVLMTTGGEPLFSLSDTDGESKWVAVGKTFNGWKLDSWDTTAGTLTLTKDSATKKISLESATVAADAGAGIDSKATLAEATALMEQMRFEEMIAKSLEQQRAVLGKMFLQMLQQQGMKDAEAQKMADMQMKLVNILFDEMDIKGMKGDIATAYSDLFTKDQLQGLSVFYSTPTGQAFIDKQPELGARMQEVMMPRMMKAMPKVQAAAVEMIRDAGKKE